MTQNGYTFYYNGELGSDCTFIYKEPETLCLLARTEPRPRILITAASLASLKRTEKKRQHDAGARQHEAKNWDEAGGSTYRKEKRNNNILLTINLSTIMKMEKEMKYEAPEVEILEITVEVGFAGSGDVEEGGGFPA